MRENCQKTIDSAFLECKDVSIPADFKNKLSEDYIVFVPNELTWHYKFKDIKQDSLDNIYINFLKLMSLNYPKYQIVMLPQLYNQKINDYQYFIKLKKLSGLNNIIVFPDTTNSDIQQNIIKNSKFVIDGRYHSIIFAINNSVPFVSLSYEHKMRGLLSDLHMSKYQIDFENLLLNEEMNKFKPSEILDKLSSISEVKRANKEAKEIASQSFSVMLDCI